MHKKLKTIQSAKIKTSIKLIILLISFSTTGLGQVTNYGILPGGLVLESYSPTSTIQNYLSGSWDIDSILDSGTPVILRLDATWCAPSWAYHQNNDLGDLYNSTGWGGANEVAIFAVENDPFSADSLLEGGPNSLGNWVTGTPFPVVNHDFMSNFVNFYLYPTVFLISTDRSIEELGAPTEVQLINSINNCNTPTPFTNDLRIVTNSSSNSSVSCRGSIMPIEIKLIIQNYSIIDINSNYNLEIIDNNGSPILGNNINISLNPYEITEVNLGLITPTLIGINNYTAIITTANDDLSNDTLPFYINVNLAEEMAVHDNQVNLDISFDAYPEEFGMVFDQEIPASNNVTNIYQDAIDGTFSPLNFVSYGSIFTASYNTNINIPNNDGCYYFMFTDSSGQGINHLTSGNGASISTNTGDMIWIGGSWNAGTIKQINFIDVLSTTKELVKEISVYPNPTQNQINIYFGTLKNVSLKIYNASNQVVYNNKINMSIFQFEFSWPAGVYIIEVSTDGFIKRTKLIVE
jgi:hypothetical protein